MKIETAKRYAEEIAARVHRVNGVLATPGCDFEAARTKRIWVFGSTVKGSKTPNDLDILIDIHPCGRKRTWRQAGIDRRYLRSYGIRAAKFNIDEALKWLTKGMKMVSRHTTSSEGAELDVKVLLYPRNDVSAWIAKNPN